MSFRMIMTQASGRLVCLLCPALSKFPAHSLRGLQVSRLFASPGLNKRGGATGCQACLLSYHHHRLPAVSTSTDIYHSVIPETSSSSSSPSALILAVFLLRATGTAGLITQEASV